MNKLPYILALTFAAASALLLAGCGRTVEPEDIGDNHFVNFSVAVNGEATATKGTMFDSELSLSKFSVTAWNNDTDNHDAFISGYQEFTLTAGKATTDIRWKKPYAKVFYAYANLPAEDASVTSSTYEGQTLTYTVPQNAADQNDILMGVYSGNGGTDAIAAIKLDHPLTAVVFKVGDFTNVKNVKKISIDGTYESGSVTQATDGTFTWTGTKYTQIVKQESATGFSIAEEIIGVPFILIPQTRTNGLKVEMVLTLTDDSELTCVGTLGGTTSGGVVWEAGKTNTYTMNVTGINTLSFKYAVTPWTEGTGAITMEEEVQQPNNEIWYTTRNNQPIEYVGTEYTYTEMFGSDLVSNSYSDIGVMKFESPVIKLDNYAFDIDKYTNGKNIQTIVLPVSTTHLGKHVFDGIGATYWPFVIWDWTPEIIFTSPITEIDPEYGDNPRPRQTFNYNVFNITIDGVTYEYYKNGSEYWIDLPYKGATLTFNITCFVNGTLITLADGSKKKVEDITYDDELRVWNFDKGCYDSAKILWLTKKGLKSEFYYKCTFSDGTVLNIVGNRQTGHRLFNATDLSFDHCNEIEAGKDVFTEHGNVKLVSCEVIDSVEVEYVNLITDQHINCFANEVLTSARYNNRYPIDQDMKFVKDDRKIRPYREFRKAGISRQWYDGMRLGEQQDSIVRVKAYIDRCELNGNLNPDWKQPCFFARIWNWIKNLFCK